MNKLIKNTESVHIYKNLNKNKLISSIERIKFGLSSEKPLSKRSLLNLMVDVYNEKINEDLKLETEPWNKKKLDHFFFDYMTQKFQSNKSVKQHIEQTIMAVLTYAPEDSRVDNFRKFLGIGDSQIRREILNIYLVLLKCKCKIIKILILYIC